MKNRKILILLMISIILTLTACVNNGKAAQASATAEVTPAVETDTGKLPSELYPAYIVSGPEKKWGYIDGHGQFIIEPVYDSASDFQVNGTAVVAQNDEWSLIDKSGKSLMESEYLYISPFSEEAAVVTDGSGQSYLINNKGQIIFNTHGSISELADGMAAFSRDDDNGKSQWGYISVEGKVVIEPQYEWAQEFSGGKAIVKLGEGAFEIIDKAGKLVKVINSDNINNLSEGVFVYTAAAGEGTRKYGYMTVDGEVMLDAVYSDAQKFEDGLAIVNAAADYGSEYGVINKNGDFVIPSKYSQIVSLKNGIYAVPEAQDYYFDSTFMKKALFDKNGKQLTEFAYYNLERLDNGLISASDETKTYLIDDNGQAVGSIPKTEGIGSIKLCGELFKADVDNNLYYFTKDGKAVWSSDNTVRFEGGLSISTKSFRPDRCMLIQYPELSGMSDNEVQGKINGLLKEKFIGNSTASNKEGALYTESVEVSYTADINKDLLIISQGGYYYPIGAAHGQPTREDYHIDLKTGRLYTLEDLFKQGSNYKERLAEILKARIAKLNKEYGEPVYSEDFGDFELSSGFAFKGDSLQIYFYPYAIASYAAGFPEFDISYDELGGIVNTEGELWKSFNRDVKAASGKPAEEVNKTDKALLEESMKNYESLIVEAVNKNDFSLVEPWLYPESTLYASQKKLVADLNQKQIRERLDGYTIDAIEAVDYGAIYRVYVTENIGIQYPGKDFETKQYNWVYSLKSIYEERQIRYQLTYIDKWEKK